jgi:hypothetical protein
MAIEPGFAFPVNILFLLGNLRSEDRSPLFELALVFVRFDHVARFIVKADHGIATELAMGSRFLS